MRLGQLIRIAAEVTFKPPYKSLGGNPFTKRYHFTGKNADKHREIDLKGLLKLIAGWKIGTPPKVHLRVIAWSDPHQGPDQSLRKEFPPEQLAAAKKYAHDLVASGKALKADLDARAFYQYQEHVVEDFGSWEEKGRF